MNQNKKGKNSIEKHKEACLFMGYYNESKTYNVYNLNKRKIVIFRNVILDESEVGYDLINVKGLLDEDIFLVEPIDSALQ
jgi:hypothetical protein